MLIDCILTAVNDDPFYSDFIPLFVKAWNKLYTNIDVKIIFISDNIPDKYLEYKDNIILFKPIENVLTCFTSQYIRLLYPCILNYNNAILITDIDMIPLNKNYFTDYVKKYSDDKFIYYRKGLMDYANQFSICYNAACPSIWKDIFKINSLEDIVNQLIHITNVRKIKKNKGTHNWNVDQIDLRRNVTEWNKKTGNLIQLDDNITKYRRLTRCPIRGLKIIETNAEKISDGYYSDYHCFRPINKHNNINYRVLDLIK